VQVHDRDVLPDCKIGEQALRSALLWNQSDACSNGLLGRMANFPPLEVDRPGNLISTEQGSGNLCFASANKTIKADDLTFVNMERNIFEQVAS